MSDKYKPWWIGFFVYLVVLALAFASFSSASASRVANSTPTAIFMIVWWGSIIPAGILLAQKGYDDVFREIYASSCACSATLLYGFWIVLFLLMVIAALGPVVWFIALLLPEKY